jgi:hypothetical protein
MRITPPDLSPEAARRSSDIGKPQYPPVNKTVADVFNAFWEKDAQEKEDTDFFSDRFIEPLNPEDLLEVPVGTLFDQSPSSTLLFAQRLFYPERLYFLKDLMEAEQLDKHQRMQAFKIPFMALYKGKRFLEEEGMTRYCADGAQIIFGKDGKTVTQFYCARGRSISLAPKYKREPKYSTLRESNMYALSVLGYSLFSSLVDQYPELSELLGKLVNMRPREVLDALEEIEETW